jgi:DNA repair exonuclease SbcCD nuclease subunit
MNNTNRPTSSSSVVTYSTKTDPRETLSTKLWPSYANTRLEISLFASNFSVTQVMAKPAVSSFVLVNPSLLPAETDAFRGSFPAINYQDPNLNVGIPVFSIHGNHDDPQGAGLVSPYFSLSLTLAALLNGRVQEGALCALDVLSVSGLVNYMGKIDLAVGDVDAKDKGIAVKPVLLRKGRTRLGLYGIGNVKDQRMHFELRSSRVKLFMPRDRKEWFNIMLVHQNR